MSIARRTLGRTGLSVSEIGFGCGTTADMMIHGAPEMRREAVAHALDLGINYFDTAPVYGDTISEVNLGLALRELGAQPIVATKVAIGPDQLDEIADAVVRSVEASLHRLGLRRLPVIQLHNRVGEQRAAKSEFGTGALLSVDDVLADGGVIDGFRKLRSRGLVDFFGCSGFGGSMAAVARLIDSGEFDTIIVNYSALNATALQPLPAPADLRDYGGIGTHGAKRDMGVVALRVLEGGALADAPLGSRRYAPPDHTQIERRANSLKAALPGSESLAATALRFALSSPGISTVLVGFSSLGQIEEAAAASAMGALPPAALAQIEMLRQTDFAWSDAAAKA